jgi:hypothetical protein
MQTGEEPLRDYLLPLLATGGRHSLDPTAAAIVPAPFRAAAKLLVLCHREQERLCHPDRLLYANKSENPATYQREPPAGQTTGAASSRPGY